MSSISVNTEIDIELTETEKEHLIQSYKILNNILDEMHHEELEDTQESIRIMNAIYNLGMTLKEFGIKDFAE